MAFKFNTPERGKDTGKINNGSRCNGLLEVCLTKKTKILKENSKKMCL